MAFFLRFAAVIGLWLFSRRRRSRGSVFAGRLDRLAWPDRVRLVANLVRDDRVPLVARGLMLLPAAYLVSPIDLLPDFIPFLGRIDDALIFSTVMDLATRLVPNTVLEQHLDDVAPLKREA